MYITLLSVLKKIKSLLHGGRRKTSVNPWLPQFILQEKVKSFERIGTGLCEVRGMTHGDQQRAGKGHRRSTGAQKARWGPVGPLGPGSTAAPTPYPPTPALCVANAAHVSSLSTLARGMQREPCSHLKRHLGTIQPKRGYCRRCDRGGKFNSVGNRATSLAREFVWRTHGH